MSREYRDIDQRYAICREQLTKHELTNGKNRKTKNTK
jgi:hypothetical protein